jgi:tetratricopeptide (TPR) repeat protein
MARAPLPPPLRRRIPRRILALSAAALLGTAALGALVAHRNLEPSRAELPLGVRAELELRDAERATVAGDLDAAERALDEAMQTLDLALAASPADPAATRAWLAAADRAVQLALRRGRPDASLTLLARASERANDLLASHPGDERAAVDAVAMTHKLVDALERAGSEPAAVAARLRTLSTLLGSARLQSPRTFAAAARTWLRLARITRGPESERAWVQAWEAAERAGDDFEADTVFDAAITAARRAGQASVAFERARRAVDWHARRARERPDDLPVVRALEARQLESAEAARAAGDASTAGLWLEAVVKARRARLATAREAAARAEASLDLARALSGLGTHHTETGATAEAEAVHGEAVRVAGAVDAAGRRVLLVALGNWAQALGRNDRIVEARGAATRSYELAQALSAQPGVGLEARLDVSVAGLRLARLLRAEPTPDRARAESVARASLAALPALDVERARTTRQGLEALLAESARR